MIAVSKVSQPFPAGITVRLDAFVFKISPKFSPESCASLRFTVSRNDMNTKVVHQAHGKVIIMIIFLIIDLGLNSTLDYDALNDSLADNVLLGIFGLQVVIQISILLILFLAAADTYLFRVGLLGMLVRTISVVLLVHPIYMALTIGVGAYRVRHLSGTGTLDKLWKNDTFIAISFIQKLGKFGTHFEPFLLSAALIVSIFFSGDPILYSKC